MKFKALLLLLMLVTLSGCGVFNRTTPQPLPTVMLDGRQDTTPQATSQAASSGGVTASGVAAPAQISQMASALGANVKAVKVAVGDQVQAGQVLVSLAGSERLAAALESANLELLMAQQVLQALKNNAGQARAAAGLRLANAQKALDDAQIRRTWMDYRIGSVTDIQAAQAAVTLALDKLKKAQDAYGPLENKGENDINRAAALDALSAAQKHYDQAVANLNSLQNQPNPVDVNQAEAVLQSAQAEAAAAQTAYDLLKNGPDPDAVTLAEERIKNAQAQITAGQASLADLDLKAPFAGTVSKLNIHSGEWVAPGQALLALADLAALQIETTDLSERDVSRVAVGQPVTVVIKALNQTVTGRVKAISPLADTLGGDVVYKTILSLDTIPAGLRAGMSVVVQW
jgi:multidrug efflux pump subunit AcrA (membrane-fusion protein)